MHQGHVYTLSQHFNFLECMLPDLFSTDAVSRVHVQVLSYQLTLFAGVGPCFPVNIAQNAQCLHLEAARQIQPGKHC